MLCASGDVVFGFIGLWVCCPVAWFFFLARVMALSLFLQRKKLFEDFYSLNKESFFFMAITSMRIQPLVLVLASCILKSTFLSSLLCCGSVCF